MAFLPVVAAVAAVAGAGITAYGVHEQGVAAGHAADYEAQVAANNAKTAEQNAQSAIAAGQEKAETQSRKTAATVGRIKAAQAASGIDVNSGSAEDVQVSERETGKLDAETVLHNAQLEAYGYRTQQTSFQSQSELDKAKAEQAPIGADIGAAGGFLSTASSVGLKWTGATGTPSGGAPVYPPNDI